MNVRPRIGKASLPFYRTQMPEQLIYGCLLLDHRVYEGRSGPVMLISEKTRRNKFEVRHASMTRRRLSHCRKQYAELLDQSANLCMPE
jgi:hypothetical protein